MNCGRFKRLLWSYVDGALSAAERQACEAHLTRCARCRQRLQTAQLTRASLQSLPRYAAPAKLLERMRAEIPAQRMPERVASRFALRHLPLASLFAIRQLPFAIRLLAPALGVLVALLWWWSQPSIQRVENERPPALQAQQASQEYANTCIDLHEQLEIAEWAGTPAASYVITTGYTR